MRQPATSTTLEVEINYSQVYVYSAASSADDPDWHNAGLRALDDAYQSKRYVGLSTGLVDVLTPSEWNFNAPMQVETWEAEPPNDFGNWDHVVDVDLDVPDGKLMFEGSGGRPPIPCDVPPGWYRARVAGRGYDLTKEGVEGMDAYRLQLWPRNTDESPTLHKRWSGWEQ